MTICEREVQFLAYEPAEKGACFQCGSIVEYDEIDECSCILCQKPLCRECSEWYDNKCEACIDEEEDV